MINLTENAVKQINSLKADFVGKALRIAVTGGGCSGLSYKLDFEEAPKADDKVFEAEGVKIFVDRKSFIYLRGMTLDYDGGLNGTGFVFNNPNATQKCGCGTSFAI